MEPKKSEKHVLKRREFIKLSAAGAAALGCSIYGCASGGKAIPEHLIPADKELSPEWIKSLTERGMAEVFSSKRNELRYIGMPIGGIGCGQLYISGDGRLWLWDIFQSNYEREKPAEEKWRLDQFTMGIVYPYPRSSKNNNIHEVQQGTAVQLRKGDDEQILELSDKHFDEITFRGEYPMARVTYKKKGLPIDIQLTATPTYIPLNVKDSSIPATLLRYSITNNSSEKVEVSLGTWLENKVCPTHTGEGTRQNTLKNTKNRTTMFMMAKGDGLDQKKGWGNMALSIVGEHKDIKYMAALPETDWINSLFGENRSQTASKGFDSKLIGGLNTKVVLESGESQTIDILISWYFPYYNELDHDGEHINKIKDIQTLSRYYKNHFNSADQVADYIALDFNRLIDTTLEWNKTWYDSTLPYWFLDRTFIPLNCLASQTSHLFDSGRFWGWEGVDCCPGTCTHVWNYAQGMARIFPKIEKNIRENVDYGIAFRDEKISYRGENIDVYTGEDFAMDGQLGVIIRTYREHQMSTDHQFLIKVWPRVKEAMQHIIVQDKDKDGLLEGRQSNTLDAAWFGPMGWISGMYLAAIKCCEQMALELEDKSFARQCSDIVTLGTKNIVANLFNGEYFIHLNPDNNNINTNNGCHIDQLLGSSMAHQVNLPDLLPEKETKAALQSIWKYNFARDGAKYAKEHVTIKGNRIYIMPGEAGVIMTTWPKGGDDVAVPGMAKRPADSPYWEGPGGYFDEVWPGQEYQLASHMIAKGMIIEGMSIVKAVHERYAAVKRNPYDEVECSSHYARSLASYGAFLAASGYKYHGPNGALGFAPTISPENFKCAFTSAEGWGTFSQKRKAGSQENWLILKYGKLKLQSFSIEMANSISDVAVLLNDQSVETKKQQYGNQLTLQFETINLIEGDTLFILTKQ